MNAKKRPSCVCGRPATMVGGKWVGCAGLNGGLYVADEQLAVAG